MPKPKGGRGLRAPYQTTQVRCPLPIKPAVMGLIEQFHRSGDTNLSLYAGLFDGTQGNSELGVVLQQPSDSNSDNADQQGQVIYLNTGIDSNSNSEQLQLVNSENERLRASLFGAESAASELSTLREQLEQEVGSLKQEVDNLTSQLELVKSESALQVQQLQSELEQLNIEKQNLQSQLDASIRDSQIANADIQDVLKTLRLETTSISKGGRYEANNATSLKYTVIRNLPLLERALKQLDKDL